MRVSEAHAQLAPWFDLWVRLIELRTRRVAVKEAALGTASVLIISPPTDTGIRMITEANAGGTTYLLCWSDRLRKTAEREAGRRRLSGLQLLQTTELLIPLADCTLDAIFANCLFDFCTDSEIEPILTEMRRTLRAGGWLRAAYMGQPQRPVERLWDNVLGRSSFLGAGVHPVDIVPALRRQGFTGVRERSLRRLGFPIRYVDCRR